jgi:hypothetical protein
MSEIHYSGFVPLQTRFYSTLVKVSPTQWQPQGLTNMIHDPPYQVVVEGYSAFRTYRGATYLPFVTKG